MPRRVGTRWDWTGRGQAVGYTLGLITVSARRNGMEWNGINWVKEGMTEWDGTGPAMFSILLLLFLPLRSSNIQPSRNCNRSLNLL